MSLPFFNAKNEAMIHKSKTQLMQVKDFFIVISQKFLLLTLILKIKLRGLFLPYNHIIKFLYYSLMCQFCCFLSERNFFGKNSLVFKFEEHELCINFCDKRIIVCQLLLRKCHVNGTRKVDMSQIFPIRFKNHWNRFFPISFIIWSKILWPKSLKN